MLRLVISAALFLAAGQALASESTFGALISQGYKISQFSIAEVSQNNLVGVMLLENGSSGFMCIADVGLEREFVGAAMNGEKKIIGLKSSEAIKWRKCAAVY